MPVSLHPHSAPMQSATLHSLSSSPSPFSASSQSAASSHVSGSSSFRLTVVPLIPQPQFPVVGCGALLSFPPSYPALLRSITAALSLSEGVERSIRLFVDEGADEPYPPSIRQSTEGGDNSSADSHGSASSATSTPASSVLWSTRRGGELSELTFALLRDSDLLHAWIEPQRPPETSQYEAAEKSDAVSDVDASTPSLTRRIELRVVDATGSTLRFQINPRKRLQQLISKYEQHRGWMTGSALLTTSTARQVGGEEKEAVQLSGQETCESLQLSDGAVLNAYKRD